MMELFFFPENAPPLTAIISVLVKEFSSITISNLPCFTSFTSCSISETEISCFFSHVIFSLWKGKLVLSTAKRATRLPVNVALSVILASHHRATRTRQLQLLGCSGSPGNKQMHSTTSRRRLVNFPTLLNKNWEKHPDRLERRHGHFSVHLP